MLALVIVLACASAAQARAQGSSLRLGAGPAYGESAGVEGLAAFQLERGALVGRLEARGMAVGRSADWERSARVLGVGVAGGVALGRTSAAAGRYIMLAADEGIDPREADRVTSLGAVLGTAFGRRQRGFAEVRYERWWQHGVRHHELPSHLLSAVVGFAIL